MCPTGGVGRAGELAEVSIHINAVELGYAAPAIIEEKCRVILHTICITRNDVCPGCLYKRIAIELCDAALAICAIELAQS